MDNGRDAPANVPGTGDEDDTDGKVIHSESPEARNLTDAARDGSVAGEGRVDNHAGRRIQ